MELKIVEYYQSKGFHIHKMIQKCPQKLSENRILLAAKEIFDEIKNGREIPDIMLGREVWRRAFDYKNEDIEKRLNIISDNLSLIKNEKIINFLKFLQLWRT